MTVFILKIIAMLTMAVDHIGFDFVDDNIVMRNIGRMAFIIYAFLMAESYYHLKDKPDRLKSHVIKLAVLSFVSEIPFDLFEFQKWYCFEDQNVIITLFLGFVALILSGKLCEKLVDKKFIAIPLCIIICGLAAYIAAKLNSNYGHAGVLLVILFYLYLRKMEDMNIPIRFLAIALVLAVYLVSLFWRYADYGSIRETIRAGINFSKGYLYGNVATIIQLGLYNRKLGFKNRAFNISYSIFYPVQYAIFALIIFLTK
jgi:hypothetical protein